MHHRAIAISPEPHGRFARAGFMALGLGLAAALLPALPARALGAPDSFAELAEQVSPSVVNITTSSLVATASDDTPMVPEGSPFDDFFKDFMDRNGQGDNDRPQRSEALGSGFVISEDGFIVTNNHVIEGADEINIEFFDGKRLEAKLVGTDPKTDIAVLKDYMTFHGIRSASAFLPKAYVDANFDLYNKTLGGQPEQAPRWKRGVDLIVDRKL